MNADGTERHQVSHIPHEQGHVEWPAWSPDGSQFAIQVGRYSKQESVAHIWIVDAATGAARKLAAHDQPYLDETPSWFPDGKRIAFQSTRTGRTEIWIINADGSAPQQVTR
jgi:TolB protein